MSRFSSSPWRVARAARTRPFLLQIRNGNADPIAVVYTNECDARLMAASIRMLPLLRTLVTAKPSGQPWQAARDCARDLLKDLHA